MTDTPHLSTTTPHPARVYDYWLGGTNHYAADAEAAEKIARIWPKIKEGAQHNRAFMHRAVRYLTAEAGIRQFLDIGTGIPTEPDLHQVAQEIAPETRVVYVDNDPIVLACADALLTSSPEGRVSYLHADVTEPDAVLHSPEVTGTLDLSQPVALSMVALLHLISDASGAGELVRRFLAAVPSGSYLFLTHATHELNPDLMARVAEAYRPVSTEGQLRTKKEIARFFDGLEFAEPGLVVTHRWRPDPAQRLPELTDAEMSGYAAVARKP